jgi:hypothetical protein
MSFGRLPQPVELAQADQRPDFVCGVVKNDEAPLHSGAAGNVARNYDVVKSCAARLSGNLTDPVPLPCQEA